MALLTPSIGLIFWTLLTFFLLLIVLKKFAWGPILGALEERENRIENSLKEAEKARSEMASLQAKNEQLLNEAREERAKILQEAKEVKDKIIGEAKEQAKAEAAKILADTKLQMEIQKQAALTEVKNQVGAMAIDIAEKLLKKQLAGHESNQEFVKSLVEQTKLN